MLTPREISDKSFDKTFGFGYRMDDVDAYLEQVASSVTELLEINADLEKKLEVLADKLNEYREDEESLRTAILGAQKLGDSVIRESKTKAEIITRDATCKAEAMVNNAKRQIEREQENLIRTQREVAGFKNRLLDMYKRHIELISALPGEIEQEQQTSAGSASPAEATDIDEAQFVPNSSQEPAQEIKEQEIDTAEVALESLETSAQDESQNEEAQPLPEGFFGINLDDDENEDDDDDEAEPPFITSDPSKFEDMRFGDAFKMKRNSNKHKFRK